MSYSRSVFFVPVLIDDFKNIKTAFSKLSDWAELSRDELSTNYLLYYAARISQDETLFACYRYIGDLPNVYLFEGHGELELSGDAGIELKEIRFSAFSTDVGFLEFRVECQNATPEDVRNFSYLFKKATKGTLQAEEEGKRPLYGVVCELCGEIGNAKPFFTATSSFKYEALCYHYINLEVGEYEDGRLKKQTKMLARSYSGLFEDINDISDYDMYFSPYSYEHWGGSTEGLVNISHLTGSECTDYYLTNYKINQLESDCYFSYLLLLNQRFAAIRYINEIAMAEDSSSLDIEALSHKIVRLKTIFSFKVISDDRIYQNIYARMYKILDIDCLVEDIKDNEKQMELIWNNAAVKRERLVTALLFVLSVLSVFSTLTDASSYFDRFKIASGISSLLSFVITVAAILTVVAVTLTRRKK